MWYDEMTTNEELYGDAVVPKIPEFAVELRLAILTRRLKEVQDVDYRLRDLELKNKLLKAIKL